MKHCIKRHKHDLGAYVTFTLAQIPCESGGWFCGKIPTEKELEAAETRWAERSYRKDVLENGSIEYQCGGCRFFAASGADFGVCWNVVSPMDGLVVFEHGGCLEHSVKVKAKG